MFENENQYHMIKPMWIMVSIPSGNRTQVVIMTYDTYAQCPLSGHLTHESNWAISDKSNLSQLAAGMHGRHNIIQLSTSIPQEIDRNGPPLNI